MTESAIITPEHINKKQYVTPTECAAIANEEIDKRIQALKEKQKNRIQRAMERTTFGAVSYKVASTAADKVVQAGGWVAATILLIAG